MKEKPYPTRVTHQQLMNKLESELLQLQDATTYRKQTATIALDIAENVTNIDIFQERKATIRQIEKLFPELDKERMKTNLQCIKCYINYKSYRCLRRTKLVFDG